MRAAEVIADKTSFMVYSSIIEDYLFTTIRTYKHIAPDNIVYVTLESVRIFRFI